VLRQGLVRRGFQDAFWPWGPQGQNVLVLGATGPIELALGATGPEQRNFVKDLMIFPVRVQDDVVQVAL